MNSQERDKNLFKQPKLYLPSDPERPSIYSIGKPDPKNPNNIIPEGRTGYRASELGRCIRALVLCKLGYDGEPFDEKSRKIMHMGNVLEPEAARWFGEVYGGVVQRQVRISMDVIDPETGKNVAVIGGVSDGLWFPIYPEFEEAKESFNVIQNGTYYDPETVVYHSKLKNESTIFGLEIKAPGDAMFDKMAGGELSESYKIQMSIYWHSYEEILGISLAGFAFVLIRRGDGETFCKFYTEPFYSKEYIFNRILTVEKLAKENGSKSGEPTVDCDTSDFFCKYWRFHKPDPLNPKAEGVYDPTLAETAAEYHELSDEIAELQAQQKHLKETLDFAMKGRDKVKTDGFTLYYSSRKFVNEMRLKAQNPDLIQKYQKFDLDACLDANPELKKDYEEQGNRTLTVRSVGKKDKDAPKVTRSRATKTKTIALHQMTAEDWDDVSDQIEKLGM